MKMTRTKPLFILITLVTTNVFVFTIIVCSSVAALSAAYCDGNNELVSQIENPTKRLELTPNKTYHESFVVKNDGCVAYDFDVAALSYAPGKNYENTFPSEVSKWTQISRHITFEQTSYHLEPGETTKVAYTINMPGGDKITGGGQYAAIAVVVKNGNDDIANKSGVNVIKRIMYQIYGKVAGKVVEAGKVLNQSIPVWTTSANLVTNYTVENSGNVDFIAYGKLVVKNLFGDVIYETPAKGRSKVFAFPETTPPTETVTWSSVRPGWYFITQEVAIFGETTASTKLILVAPLELVIAILVGLFSVVFLTIYSIRRRKIKPTHRPTSTKND
jgi:hypothetical protein